MGVDLLGVDLVRIDLVGIDLVGVDFMRVDLVGLIQCFPLKEFDPLKFLSEGYVLKAARS